MKDPGDLLYCKKRGNIRCCFENAVCTEFMEWGSDDLEEATSYLNETLAYLNGLVKSTGYSSCHHLGTSLDASKCAKDCEKLKKKILLRIALHTVDYLSVVLEEIRHVAMSAGKSELRTKMAFHPPPTHTQLEELRKKFDLGLRMIYFQ